jgi:hypothetical protein
MAEAYDKNQDTPRHKEKRMTQAKGETVSPASRLATPTDLIPAEVWAVIGVGNPLIADALALYSTVRPRKVYTRGDAAYVMGRFYQGAS